jgi:hypothetical protein
MFMSPRSVDWIWVGGVAFVLIGSAAFVVFVIRPGGFEGGGYWAMVLLPGASLGLLVPDNFLGIAAQGDSYLFWAVTFAFSFVWYFAIAYIVTKSCRFLIRALRS